jgi:hypothetical protein
MFTGFNLIWSCILVSWIYFARFRWVVMIFAGFLVLGDACGIVLHPGDGEPNYVEWTDRPGDEVVCRWGINASCVVISRNCVITTRHQGGGVGVDVEVGGVTYEIERIWNHPGVTDFSDGSYSGVDLRIAQLADANFVDCAGLYSDYGEAEFEDDIVIGGFGVGRGKVLESEPNDIVYGYEWEEDSAGGNRNLRWCTNRIDFTMDNIQTGDQKHDFVVADFDGPFETVYEGVVAGYDSGGGWFAKVDGEWELVGLTRGVDHAGSRESWFMSKNDPTVADADRMDGLRMSSYAEWAGDVLEEVCRYGECGFDMGDAAEFAGHWLEEDCSELDNYCDGWDINRDGFVDFGDFGVIAGNFSIERDE